MQCFIDATLQKSEYPYTLAEDKKILDTLRMIEKSCIKIEPKIK